MGMELGIAMDYNICRRAFCLAPNERELSNLVTLSILPKKMKPLFSADIHIMEERGAPLLGKARGTSENLGKQGKMITKERKKKKKKKKKKKREKKKKKKKKKKK